METINSIKNSLSDSEYARIEAAIRFIDEHYQQQPASAEIAAVCGLSDAHFSRLFKRWCGLAPGRYLQQRTVLHARKSLDANASVLDAALDSGLSGAGRLHDLFVRIEAMSPGEYKSGGEGLQLRYGLGATPFGQAFVLQSERGIVELQFVSGRNPNDLLDRAKTTWHNANVRHDSEVAETLHNVFQGSSEIVVTPQGTNFQLQVWRALLSIPEASTTDYGTIAKKIGKPSAARAVGSAVGANPVAWLIPCHRVLQRNGSLGGYRWGPDRKRTILGWENTRLLENPGNSVDVRT